ncbi:hypothetical protein Gogos_020672 [Gossypium gossypioides]|uniref:Uncharacterized protein n=1 Tax=Gossypium gossypioides TaxID=34282 RepID=A0A7J9D7P3_GOSGO|nr:hypothetical protein [Gossypium gossypioides]
MHPLEKFVGFDLNTSEYEEKSRRIRLKYLGVVIFPKVLGYIDKIVSYLFDRLDKRVTPVPVILAETFRFLSACRRAGEERFIGCATLVSMVL